MDRGFVLWLTGLSGSGKTTLAHLLAEEISARGRAVEALDGDEVRMHLSKGLGFTREDRDTHILRVGFVCELLARNGVIAIASVISPYRETRDRVRAQIPDFVEVYVECPLEECARRDVKGLYRQAFDGAVPAFTGVSDPYEPPEAPEIRVSTMDQTPDTCVRQILDWLDARGLLESPRGQIPLTPVGQLAAEVDSSAAHAGEAYSAEEEALVSARLEALGYL